MMKKNTEDDILKLDYDIWLSGMWYDRRDRDALPLAEALMDEDRFTEKSNVRLLWDFGQRRNRVLAIEFRGKRYVAKRYKNPGFFRGWYYRIFRSKAERAFENAQLLELCGFKTARAVVAWDEQRYGRLGYSWFISELLPYNMISDFRSDRLNEKQKQVLMSSFSRYLYRIHYGDVFANFIPLDVNISNFFYKASEGFYGDNPREEDIEDFWIIDINRMKLRGNPGKKLAMKAFDQLGTAKEDYPYLLEPYVKLAGWSVEECGRIIEKFHRYYARKKKLKKLFRL